MDSLGDRIKRNYEDRARFYLTRRMPVIVRIDGRAFHSYTKYCKKPFDTGFMQSMIMAAQKTADEMQGCKLVYIQSDEISFALTDYDKLETEAWFDYNKSKIESVTASLVTGWFNLCISAHRANLPAAFDARAFNIPESEIVNYFLWRAQDWHRNSIQMFARAHFSHKACENKNLPELHEMLHRLDLNWTNLTPKEKNGTFLVKGAGKFTDLSNVEPNYESINELWEQVNVVTD